MTRIISKKAPQVLLSPAERGVLWHLLETRAADGTVQQHYTDIAQTMGTSPSTIHRHIQALVVGNAVEVITPSKKDRRGYPIPPVLKPIPPVEYAHSACGILHILRRS